MRWVFFLALVLLPLTIHAQGIRQVISLDSEYRNNETMVWTPSIQKCWDEMSIFYKLQNPTFEPPNLIDKELNAFQWSYDTTVPKASNFIMLAGTGEEYWRQANQLLQKHFGNSIPPFAIEDFGGREPDLGLVLVNVLKHSLTFNTQLSPITPPLIFRTRLPTQPFKKVESFGTLGDKRKEVAGQFEATHPQTATKISSYIAQRRDPKAACSFAALRWHFAQRIVVQVFPVCFLRSVLSMFCGRFSKVYAVEFTDMANHARRLVAKNGVEDVVEVIQSSVEELKLDAKVREEKQGVFTFTEGEGIEGTEKNRCHA